MDLESLRRAAGAAIRNTGDAKTVALALPASTDEQIRAVVEGALLGGYIYDRYLGKKADQVDEIVVLTDRARSKVRRQTRRPPLRSSPRRSTSPATLSTLPPNDLYPQSFADELQGPRPAAEVEGDRHGLRREGRLATKGYGGIIGRRHGARRDSRGSPSSPTSRPRPRLTSRWWARGSPSTRAVFPSRPGRGMMTMKCDMAGAAAMSAAVFAIAELGLPVRVTGYACLAENMPSGGARPAPATCSRCTAARPSRC